MIDMNRKYQTRDGRLVEILRTNVKNVDFPVVGIITERDGSETQGRWMENGSYSSVSVESRDLFLFTAKHGGWAAISVSRSWMGKVYVDYADACADARRQTESHDAPQYYVTRVYWED